SLSSAPDRQLPSFPTRRSSDLKIRTVKGTDDFAMLYEVLSRRAKRGLESGDLPDLFVIDGGKGQLGSAAAALRDAGVERDIVSLDRKSTRLNSSHVKISYAVFC